MTGEKAGVEAASGGGRWTYNTAHGAVVVGDQVASSWPWGTLMFDATISAVQCFALGVTKLYSTKTSFDLE